MNDSKQSFGREQELNVESIKAEAKRVMDEFLKALEKAIPEGEELQEFFVERPLQVREDFESMPMDTDFKKLFFENAPRHNARFLLAEKKHW